MCCYMIVWFENVNFVFRKIADGSIVWLPWLQKLETFLVILFFAFQKQELVIKAPIHLCC